MIQQRSDRRLTWREALLVLLVLAAFVADLLTSPPVPDPDPDPVIWIPSGGVDLTREYPELFPWDP